MKKNNFIFDLDDTVVKAIKFDAEKKLKEYEETLGKSFTDNYMVNIMGYPHMIFPGFYEVFRWIIERGDNLYFFSNALEERNEKLVKFLIEKSMMNIENDVFNRIKIFSRKDCINLGIMTIDEMQDLVPYIQINGTMQKVYGQKKKKLEGLLVTKKELKNTLLFDDDYSYMVKGEEDNFIKINSDMNYFINKSNYSKLEYESFHKAYYIIGLIQRAVMMEDKEEISLTEACHQLKDLNDHIEYGFKILKEMNNDLKIYFDYGKE